MYAVKFFICLGLERKSYSLILMIFYVGPTTVIPHGVNNFMFSLPQNCNCSQAALICAVTDNDGLLPDGFFIFELSVPPQ